MKNNDFRKFLTKDKKSDTDELLRRTIKAEQNARRRKKKEQQKRAKENEEKGGIAFVKGKEGAAAEVDSVKYRDRAAERRSGKKNQDYAGVELDASQVESEYTVFLGGDEQHTHLVKGLDVLFLEKQLKEKQLKEKQLKEKEKKIKHENQNPTMPRKVEPEEGDANPKFHGWMARNLYNALDKTKRYPSLSTLRDMHLPGRTTYQFRVSVLPGSKASKKAPKGFEIWANRLKNAWDVAPILSRSLRDVAPRSSNVRGFVSESLVSKIAAVFDPVKKKEKRKARRERQKKARNEKEKEKEKQKQVKVDDSESDDDAIFGDAGDDYVASSVGEIRKAKAEEARRFEEDERKREAEEFHRLEEEHERMEEEYRRKTMELSQREDAAPKADAAEKVAKDQAMEIDQKPPAGVYEAFSEVQEEGPARPPQADAFEAYPEVQEEGPARPPQAGSKAFEAYPEVQEEGPARPPQADAFEAYPEVQEEGPARPPQAGALKTYPEVQEEGPVRPSQADAFEAYPEAPQKQEWTSSALAKVRKRRATVQAQLLLVEDLILKKKRFR